MHYIEAMAKRTFNIRVEEQFFEDLKAIQDAQDFAPTQTEVVSALVSKVAKEVERRGPHELVEREWESLAQHVEE